MGKKYLRFIGITVLFIIIGCQTAKAQSATDVLRYSLQYPEGDPVSMIMPSVSYAAGFGSYQQNPASAAFFDRSFLSIGMSDRYVNEKGTYIFNTTNHSDNQFNMGNVGFVYKVPTSRGKFVIGAGYSQSHDFNRAISGHAFNEATSITDFYKVRSLSGKNLYNAAYDAYTIGDMYNNNGDFLYSISIFEDPKDPAISIHNSDLYRILPKGVYYRGINQNFNLTRRGVLGEYSVFLGVELVKNLEVGASIGVISGDYRYERHFLESDSKNVYHDAIILSDDGYTDVDHISNIDKTHDSFTGFSARLGFIYQISPHLNFGAAYQFKNVLHIQEDFSTHIKNTLDNGDYFKGKVVRQRKHKIVRPSRLNIGITAKDISGFTISASAQRVAYSKGRIELVKPADPAFENDINQSVKSNLNDVFNLRIGVAYQVNDRFTPRIGYGHYPSPTELVDAARNFYSIGFSARLSQSTTFNAGAQLGIWDDQNRLYDTLQGYEAVDENVKHWNIMAGLTFNF